MRAEGFEPPRPLGHEHLKLECLPFHHARVTGARNAMSRVL
jgi:hypothetical protein